MKKTVPIIEEQLLVGKRTVEQDRVRVRSQVKEIPVEESVTLREEHLTVERRPVDRVVTDAVFDAFEEGTIRVTAQAEEAVVTKEARVVEEVVIRKDVGQRTEHITDTVRRTDVQVEQTGPSGALLNQEFGYYDNAFRADFNSNYSSNEITYDYYEPAYRYGYDLRTSDRYGKQTWVEIEPEVQHHWEERNPGTWETFKNAVRHAWQNVKN